MKIIPNTNKHIIQPFVVPDNTPFIKVAEYISKLTNSKCNFLPNYQPIVDYQATVFTLAKGSDVLRVLVLEKEESMKVRSIFKRLMRLFI